MINDNQGYNNYINMNTESLIPIENIEFLTPSGPWRLNYNHSTETKENPETGEETEVFTAKFVEAHENTRSAFIVALIRRKYSSDDESAIVRKKLAGIDKLNEFDAYNTYVESCKQIYNNIAL